MKICVQTGGVTNRIGIDEGIRLIRETGFDAVDLNLDHLMQRQEFRDKVTTGIFDKPDDEIRAMADPFKKALEANGVEAYQAHAPFPSSINDPGFDKYMIRVLEKHIMLSAYVGCKNLVVHPISRVFTAENDMDTEHLANIELYTALIPAARKYGVTICLENMFTAYKGKIIAACCNNPYEAAAYIDELNAIAGEELFAFCLDIGHATLVGADPLRTMQILGERIRAFHIHDNDGKDDNHMLPYTGVTHWNRFIQGLKSIGFSGALSFETFNATETFPVELTPDVLRLIAATGRYFSDCVEGKVQA